MSKLKISRKRLRLGKYTHGYENLTSEQLHGLLWLLGEWSCRANRDGSVDGCHPRARGALHALVWFRVRPLDIDEAKALMRGARPRERVKFCTSQGCSYEKGHTAACLVPGALDAEDVR